MALSVLIGVGAVRTTLASSVQIEFGVAWTAMALPVLIGVGAARTALASSAQVEFGVVTTRLGQARHSTARQDDADLRVIKDSAS